MGVSGGLPPETPNFSVFPLPPLRGKGRVRNANFGDRGWALTLKTYPCEGGRRGSRRPIYNRDVDVKQAGRDGAEELAPASGYQRFNPVIINRPDRWGGISVGVAGTRPGDIDETRDPGVAGAKLGGALNVEAGPAIFLETLPFYDYRSVCRGGG